MTRSYRWLMSTIVVLGVFALSPTYAPALAAEASAEMAEKSCAGLPEPERKHEEQLRAENDSTMLPECRVYEQVSPAYKEGDQFFLRAESANGERAIFASLANVAGVREGNETVTESGVYLASRSAAGWALTPLNDPSAEFSSTAGFTANTDEVESGEQLWRQIKHGSSRRFLYAGSTLSGFTMIGPLTPPGVSETEVSEFYDQPVAATRDFGHVLIYADHGDAGFEQWPGDQTEASESLYEYSGSGNSKPILVGVDGPEKGSESLIGVCGVGLGAGFGNNAFNALSENGETVFFTVEPRDTTGCGSLEAPEFAQVWARLHGSKTSPGPAKSIDVSASECTVACGSEESGNNFEGASENGEKVFFTSTQKLTNEAVDATTSGNAAPPSRAEAGCGAVEAGTGGCNLYEYDFGAPGSECQEEHKCLKLISAGEVLGVAAIARNGERVYFVSRNKLAASGPQGGAQPGPESGAPNLYVYNTKTEQIGFVVTLQESADREDWSRRFERPVETGGSGGQYLVFASSNSGLTEDDTSQDRQLFEYRPEEVGSPAELARVTQGERIRQGEEGYNENGNAVRRGVPESWMASTNEMYDSAQDFHSMWESWLAVANSGLVVFRTAGRLSARAVSAEDGCMSLYEFDPPGGVLSEGSVHLVSDGRDVQEINGLQCGVHYLGMDESGHNILFDTADPLTPSDVDGLQRDVYDARVDGGFAPASSAERSGCAPSGCGMVTSGVPVTPAASLGSPEALLSPILAPMAPHKTVAEERAARLTRALKTCRKKHGKGKRVACEERARKASGRGE